MNISVYEIHLNDDETPYNKYSQMDVFTNIY